MSQMSDTVKSKPVTQVQVNPAVSNGLRNGFIEQTPQETSPSATINGEGSTERQPQCMANGHSLYLVPHASAVIKKLFHNILPLAGVEKDVVKDFEISDIALQRISSNHELLNRVVSLATSYMNSSDKSIESWIDQFRRLGLELSHTTVQSEFRCIVRTLFSDGKNFGRVLSFLTFAVAYAVFVYRLGMKKAVFSVQVWTVEVIERDLSKFFYDNKGWEGFANFLETLIRAQKRPQTPTEPSTMWEKLYAFGAVAAGAAAVIGLKQVFS